MDSRNQLRFLEMTTLTGEEDSNMENIWVNVRKSDDCVHFGVDKAM